MIVEVFIGRTNYDSGSRDVNCMARGVSRGTAPAESHEPTKLLLLAIRRSAPRWSSELLWDLKLGAVGHLAHRLGHQPNPIREQDLRLIAVQVVHWVGCRGKVERKRLLPQNGAAIQLLAHPVDGHSNLMHTFQHLVKTRRRASKFRCPAQVKIQTPEAWNPKKLRS
jgi:hypothetical protein